jgi:hypothetical protein
MYTRGRVGLLLVALWAAGPGNSAFAQSKAARIKIRVDSVLATDGDMRPGRDMRSGRAEYAAVKMDKRLRALHVADRLTMMFNYASYQLLRHQAYGVALGDAVAFNLPGAYILHVSPLAIRGNILMLDLVMFEGARLIMRMPMRIVGDGMLMLVDEHRPGRYYITAISADCPQLQHAPGNLEIDEPAPLQAYPAFIPAQ